MKKYFVSYEQSLDLKEIGYVDYSWFGSECSLYKPNGKHTFYMNGIGDETYISAPLKSQVFEWFRKNHLLGHEINCPFISYSGKLACIKNEGRYELYITDEEQLSLPEDIFYSTDYFEAESKAIDKLIEIVKNK